MSVHLKNASHQPYKDKVSPYDVKIIASKRIVSQPRFRNRNSTLTRDGFKILPALQRSSASYQHVAPGTTEDVRGQTRARTALPPLVTNDDDDDGPRRDQENQNDVTEFQRQLQRLDLGKRGLLTAHDITKQLKNSRINIPNDQLKRFLSKCVSSSYPGLYDYDKLISELMKTKKRPSLDAKPTESKPRNRIKDASMPNKSTYQAKTVYLRQEEMPLLKELRRQLLQFGSLDLATLYRHVNEADRERKGVLTKSQIQTILNKNGIRLTDNLLESLLHYSDRDGYRLYSVTKFLDYFDRAVKEDRTLLRGNNSPRFASRIRSPPPKSPPPVLDPMVMPLDELVEEEEMESDLPFDRNHWIRRFNSMASALGDSYQRYAGYLPTEEVQHIAETYNLVYNLEIPNSLIGQSISRAFNRGNNQVEIQQFLSDLQNSYLHLRSYQ